VADVTRVGHTARWLLLGLLLVGAAAWSPPRPVLERTTATAAAALVLVALASTLWSVEPRVTFERAISLGLLLLTCALLGAAVRGRPERAGALLAGLLGGAVAVGLAGLVMLAVAHGDAVQAATYEAPARYRGFGQDANTVPLLFALAVPLGIWALGAARSGRTRILAAGALLLFVGTIVASGSKGGLLAAALGAAAVLVLHGGLTRRSLAAVAVVAAALVVGAAIQSVPEPHATAAAPAGPGSGSSSHVKPGYVDAEAVYPLEADVGRPLPGGGEPPVRRSFFGASGRVDAWKGALHEAARRPIVGHGFGTEREVFVDRYYRFVGGLPESSYIGMLLQLGAVGLAALLALLAVLAAPALRHAEALTRDLAAAGLGVVVAGLAIAVVQSYVYSVGNIAAGTFWAAAFLIGPVSAGRRARGARPRLLVLNQYYRPGLEATAHLLSQLCEALADDYDVTVVTGRLAIPPAGPGRTTHAGVEIVRVRSTAFDRSRLFLRGLNYVTYILSSLRAGLFARRPDVVLCMTDPPVIANVAHLVARRFRVPVVVVSQDVFPEIAVELKRLSNPVLVGLLRAMIGHYLRRADRVVAIGETMRRRLESKGARPERIRVIPNWVDTEAIRPSPKANAWSREHGLDDRFVVMHSGNVGHAQNLDALIWATTFLRDLDDLVVAIIGGGARHARLLELAERVEADHVRFLGYQPRETLSLSLSTADLHVVGLARGLAGYVVPSRLYGILAAGRPVIVAAERDSETAQVVEREGCGLVVPPGRPEVLAEAIRAAYDGDVDLAEMGRRGRDYVVREADRSVAISRYRSVLRELAPD
jgi:glycosyltransferase involved in cell wall biosynthesis